MHEFYGRVPIHHKKLIFCIILWSSSWRAFVPTLVVFLFNPRPPCRWDVLNQFEWCWEFSVFINIFYLQFSRLSRKIHICVHMYVCMSVYIVYFYMHVFVNTLFTHYGCVSVCQSRLRNVFTVGTDVVLDSVV